MPYLILAIGILLGLFALYRFFIGANVAQIKAVFLALAALSLALAVFFLSITGRLPAAIAIVVATLPFVAGYLKSKKTRSGRENAAPHIDSKTEALEILGLEDGASKDEIKAAYKRLMQKVHPDHEGSEWMAAKLNQAKDLLLKDR